MKGSQSFAVKNKDCVLSLPRNEILQKIAANFKRKTRNIPDKENNLDKTALL